MQHNSAEYLHTLIEALQLSFADSQWYCADPSHINVPTQGLLNKTYAAERRALMKPGRYVIICHSCNLPNLTLYIVKLKCGISGTLSLL